MKIHLQKDSTVEEVKKVFTTYYPFLRLELYNKPVAPIKKAPLLLNKLIPSTDKTVIDINNRVTVAELENQFENIGLIAEVFRKSGNVWVETSLTSNWTLYQQNAEGEEISRHFSIKETD